MPSVLNAIVFLVKKHPTESTQTGEFYVIDGIVLQQLSFSMTDVQVHALSSLLSTGRFFVVVYVVAMILLVYD